MKDRDRKTQTMQGPPRGNLWRAYGEDLGWGGCANQDCLPQCNTSEGHCERLKLFLERGKPN